MSSRYESGRYADADLDDLRDPRHGGGEREISLGTATILGIFFALALLCALFFGFGYSMGRRSVQQAQAAAAVTDAPAGDNGGLKASPQATRQSAAKPSPAGDETEADAPVSTPAPTNGGDRIVVKDAGQAAALKPVTGQVPQPTAPPSTQVAAPVVVAAGTPGSAMVQVAAVSHQEDADVLAAALKRKGYNVSVRSAPQDKLLHVQIGPFASKKDATAMQQRLQSDGYNAIVK